MPETDARPVLLTGATGYVGGRLLETLQSAGVAVRCLARKPEFLRARAPARTEVVEGDVLDASSLRAALLGVDAAYYLVHSMGERGDFVRRDREAALAFGEAAVREGVRRVIYLGGLGEGPDLSPHLASRQEVGRLLRAATPTIELRASIIIGSGSSSFEMLRALVERLPVMVTPSWVRTPTQPIAIEDVIDYLLAALRLDARGSRCYEIGGADRVSYGDLMREYARQRGLRRLMIPLPVLTPGLSSLWLGLVTPVYARIGRELVEGLRNPTVVRDPAAVRDFDVRPRGVREAIERALRNEDRGYAATRWSDALSTAGGPRRPVGRPGPPGRRRIDAREASVAAPPGAAFAPIQRIGGEAGWYFADRLWRLRGFLDLLAGGVGSRRGRRDPDRLRPGDTVDFWRVEAFEPDRRLRLRAEMRLPGRAWITFEVEPRGSGSVVRQIAEFDPRGLAGRLYWYALYPVHALVFRGMLRGVVRRAAPMAPP